MIRQYYCQICGGLFNQVGSGKLRAACPDHRLEFLRLKGQEFRDRNRERIREYNRMAAHRRTERAVPFRDRLKALLFRLVVEMNDKGISLDNEFYALFPVPRKWTVRK